MVVMPPLSSMSNAGSFEPSQMLTSSCRRNFSRSIMEKVSHLLEISHMYYTTESGVAAMCASKAIHALLQGHQPQKKKPQKSTSLCLNCTHSHSCYVGQYAVESSKSLFYYLLVVFRFSVLRDT